MTATKEAGWRKPMPDMRARADRPIVALDVHNPEDADVIRRLLHLLDSQSANVRAEERIAWDQYAAAATRLDGYALPDACAVWADDMLAERRKRFGGKDGGQ